MEEAQPEAPKSADQVTPERVNQEVAAQVSWSSEEDTPAPQIQSSSLKVKQKASQRPDVGDLEENQWQGEVIGKISTNREALKKLEEKVKELEDRMVREW